MHPRFQANALIPSLPSLYHDDVICEWSLIKFLILQEGVHLKSMVYNFSRIVFIRFTLAA